MKQTFDQLGIPFPLFQGPVGQASEYCGLGACRLCGSHGQHCFELGIGCALIRECSGCGTSVGLDAYNRVGGVCPSCNSHVPFPKIPDGNLMICYACLRAGRAAITKDTELGMVSWEQAADGVTHGAPGLRHPDFEMVPRDGGWTGARLPRETMQELLRTPTFTTIQGERWLFCCRQPMVFVGAWERQEFSKHASDGNGPRLFAEIVEDAVPGLWEDELHDETGVYVFRCAKCARLRANWDLA